MFKGKWLINLTLLTLKGELSLTDSLAWGIARIKHKPLSLSLRGIKFNKVDATFWGIITDVFVNQVYTPPGFEINTNDIVLDIGSHKGAFVAYAAIEKAGRIIAYEPNLENFSDIKEFVETNQFKQVNLHQKGLGAKTGKAELHLSAISSRHSIIPQKEVTENHNEHPSMFIEVLSLADCIKDLDKVDFMKMDCEDAEREILLNANSETISKIKKMAIEIHLHANSVEIQLLIKHLKTVFDHIRIDQDINAQYGYIYASQ